MYLFNQNEAKVEVMAYYPINLRNQIFKKRIIEKQGISFACRLYSDNEEVIKEFLESDFINIGRLFRSRFIENQSVLTTAFEYETHQIDTELLKKRKSIIQDYISGKYDKILPTTIYGKCSYCNYHGADDDILYHCLPTEKITGNYQLEDILILPKELYLLSLILNGKFLEIQEKDEIAEQLNCFHLIRDLNNLDINQCSAEILEIYGLTNEDNYKNGVQGAKLFMQKHR